MSRKAFLAMVLGVFGLATRERPTYATGGLVKKPQKAVVGSADLYLPLDNPRVMRTVQASFGTGRHWRGPERAED